MITAEELREMLDYDPATGVFTWRAGRNNQVKEGQKAGSLDNKLYVRIWLNGRGYRAHRLAWLYVYGVWPLTEIDHINCIRGDNRIINLRAATSLGNNANRQKKKNCSCVCKGVYKYRTKFRAQIRIGGKKTYIGTYSTEKEAHAAYVAAAEKEFGAFARAE